MLRNYAGLRCKYTIDWRSNRMKPRLMFLVLFIVAIVFVGPTYQFASADDNAQQTVFGSPILVVNTSFMNIRTGPSASYGILATVPGGTELPVLAVYEDGVWYQVATNVGVGWVNFEFTLARGDFSRVPQINFGAVAPVTGNVPVASLGQGGGVVVATTGSSGGLLAQTGVSFIGGDLYSAPGGNSPVVVALAPADENRVYPLLGVEFIDNRPFYQVNYAQYGVVWSDRFRVRPLNCGGQTVIEATRVVGTLPIGNATSFEFQTGDEMIVAGPGRDGLIEVLAPDGSRGLVPVDATQSATTDTTYICDGVATTSVGVPVTTVTTTTVNPGQGGGGVTAAATSGARLVVNTGNLNIRSGPSASYGIVATVPGGTELPVTAVYEDGIWYQVATSAGLGWVNFEFTLARGDFSRVPQINFGSLTAASIGQANTATAVTSVVTSAARVVVNTPNLNVRSGPSAQFSVVATVSGGTELAVLGVADDGVWYLVDGTFGRGWLNNEFVLFRGDYNAVPVLNINP